MDGWGRRWGRRVGATVLVLALVLAGTGCGSDETGPTDPGPDTAVLAGPVEVRLSVGEEDRPGGGALQVGFLGVVEDSRCPVDVTCVWEGNAVVEISVAMGSGPSVPLQLNTTLEPRSRTHQGVQITVVELRPEPISDAPTSDYELRLRLEPAA